MSLPAITFHPTATVVPIEDLKDGDVVHTSQLLPTDVINVANVYDLATLGLSLKGIAAKLRMPYNSFLQHFSKTVAQAYADAATEKLLCINEISNGEVDKTSGLKLDASKYLIEKRLDPTPKDPIISIGQATIMLPPQAATLSVDDVNEL